MVTVQWGNLKSYAELQFYIRVGYRGYCSAIISTGARKVHHVNNGVSVRNIDNVVAFGVVHA